MFLYFCTFLRQHFTHLHVGRGIWPEDLAHTSGFLSSYLNNNFGGSVFSMVTKY